MRIISVIMGPTFSGKTTYLNKQWIKDRFGHHIIAHTTRPSREDEEDGIDYYFDSFLSDSYQRICVRQYKVANGDIWSYWINKNDILDNRNNYIILDYTGFNEIYEMFNDDENTEVIGFYMATPLSIIEDRIKNSSRKNEDIKETTRRLHQDIKDFEGIYEDSRVKLIK